MMRDMLEEHVLTSGSLKSKTQTLRVKFQIKRNIMATCVVDVVEANDRELRAFVGSKARKDTLLPVGTRVYFNAESIHKITARRSNTFDIFSVTVQEIEDAGGKPLHVCTPILKESHPDLRAMERKPTQFLVTIDGTETEFIAKDGTGTGLTLLYQSKKAVLSLKLGESYPFRMVYKDEAYSLPGIIRHIHYDWKTHDHIVGVHFPKLGGEEEMVLQRLIDPTFVLDISSKQTVDTASGKVSRDS